MALQTDRALILRRFAFGESSLVLHALTREQGRVHLIARGAYRPTSRIYGVLDLFDTLELEWVRRRSQELSTLRAARQVRRRQEISRAVAPYRAAQTVLELSGLDAREGQAAPALFALAEEALERLAAGRTPPQAALVVFELGFLHNLGLAPALESCAACGGAAPPIRGGAGAGGARAAFSAGAGGRLCRRCAEEARASGRRVGTLPDRTLLLASELAEFAVARPVDQDPPRLAPERIEKVRDLVARFIEYHLESRPKSYEAFLAAPNRNGPQGPEDS